MEKIALVTGSSRGIGRAVARELARQGWRVCVNYRVRQDCAESLAAELAAEGHAIMTYQADVSQRQQVQAMVRAIQEKWGPVSLLVNNAGVAPRVRADLLEMSEESFDYVLGVNTKGNMFLTQAVAKQMIRQAPLDGRKGVIVNVSSCSSVVSSVNRGEYCVSKAGVSMLTTLYADRLAHEVRPGVIATDMTSAVQDKYDKMIGDGMFPIARWGTPQDVANAVSALCSDKFLYTTGNYIDVDGGFHIKRL